MSRVLFLSIAIAAGCAWPPVLRAQVLPYAPCNEPLVRLPPVDSIPAEVVQAQRLQAAAAEVANDGNQVIGLGQPNVAAPPTQALPDILPPEAYGEPVLRLPPVELEQPPRKRSGWIRDLVDDVATDYRNFYSLGNLAALGAGLGVGAAMANTPTDEKLRDFWQENVRTARSDEYWEAFHAAKVFGNGYYAFPAYAGAALVGLCFDEGTFGRGVGDWGSGSLRAIGVGGPMMLGLQYVTGGARPREELGSQWTPFKHTHGVSGHAFMGAVPFMTAAKMVDSPFWKTVFYAGSVFPGLSRINDEDHYASQVLLGWWIAYLAATAVDHTNTERANFTFGPMPMADGVGIGMQWRR